MAPAFCPLSRNDPLQIERYYAFRWFEDADEQSADLNRIWKLKHALGCPICARYRKYGNNGVCGRCKKLRRIVRAVKLAVVTQIPAMLLTWRNDNLSIEVHKVYKRARELMEAGQRVLK